MIGPYFFENDDGTTGPVNSERYGHMAFFLPFFAIEKCHIENMWFQQGGATCYTTRVNLALLQEIFHCRHQDHPI